MKDWFKARNIWGAAITALTDEEAGRLAKAIWAFTMDGEIRELEGAGKGILAMILMTLGQDAEKDDKISDVRAIAGKKGGLNTSYGKHQQMMAIASNSKQTEANGSNCSNKNKNIDKEQESESELIGDAEAREIQNDQNRVLDAAEDAGFKMSNNVMASLIELCATYGIDKVLDGLKSCSEHGAVNLAYLKAVLNGKPKQNKPAVVAQQYEQRDYTGVNDEMRSQTDELMKQFMSERGAG